ncbi:helix-turn-helix domain-containing protein [Paenibacillus sp. S150]|uniref:helix-turn-helix domain-containing protein n=1 Tax=Paenibacillus sp. S150 TaxID=2749826 RepID=UPI001C596093|nr:helix-turn-helix transcriptional regulator [Paenibacillus sp. S150]MBW4083893.1 helix-turn-helix transcriptional regulator [Paenibacillus sp. S150]
MKQRQSNTLISAGNKVTFAVKTEISQGRVGGIEQGKTKPSAEILIELRKEFNADLNWLFDGDK